MTGELDGIHLAYVATIDVDEEGEPVWELAWAPICLECGGDAITRTCRCPGVVE